MTHLVRVSGQLGHRLPVLEVGQLAGVEPGEGGQNGGDWGLGAEYWYQLTSSRVCILTFSPLSKGFDVGDDGRVLAPGQPLLQQQHAVLGHKQTRSGKCVTLHCIQIFTVSRYLM